MDRRRQPAMWGPEDRKGKGPDAGNPDRVGAVRRSWALTRWVILVVSIGLGTAASIAIAITVLLDVLDANL